MKTPIRVGVIASIMLGTVSMGIGSCVDPADMADWTENQAYAADDDDDGLSALESSMEIPDSEKDAGDGTGTTDSGDSEIGSDSEVIIEQGEVYLFLPQYHDAEELEIHSEAANPADQEAIPYRMNEDGSTVSIDCPKGITKRFVLNSVSQGQLRCEVKTNFDRVGFKVNFSKGAIVFVPISEGEGL